MVTRHNDIKGARFMKQSIERISNIGIIPVVRIDDIEDAIPLANAMFEGGIDCAEITFRSNHAKEAIQRITKNNPNMLVGAGTVLTIEQAKDAIEAGASFIITPGFNADIVSWCIKNEVLVIPGVSSASEIEMALSYGLQHVKFFPAESSGGTKRIKDLSAPYQMIRFIPTGGIDTHNMHDYLSLPCVDAIGGSFMLPIEAIQNKDWGNIKKACQNAIDALLDYQLIHIGINNSSKEEAMKTATLFSNLFYFPIYEKPKSTFAGKGFEILHCENNAIKGHVGIYTPYPQRAIYQLAKQNITVREDSVTRNKKTKQINFAYLDLTIAGFDIHLINPDTKMR